MTRDDFYFQWCSQEAHVGMATMNMGIRLTPLLIITANPRLACTGDQCGVI